MENLASPCAVAQGGLHIEVKAKPRSAKPGVGPVEEGALVVRLSSAPADGAANEELARVLAKALGVPKTAVAIVRGETSRHKRVLVRCGDPAGLMAKIGEFSR